jgi:hypothetical protein
VGFNAHALATHCAQGWGGAQPSLLSAVPPTLRDVEMLDVGVGEVHTIAMLKNGSVAVWASGGASQPLPQQLDNQRMRAVRAAGKHCAAITADNSAVFWVATTQSSTTTQVVPSANAQLGP